MEHLNVEIKARCSDSNKLRALLGSWKAISKGTDHQIDTYFKVNDGRLKLREGSIENYLIYYSRENIAGPKQSHVSLFPTTPNSPLKELLVKSLSILAVVDKQREIYFVENVKFHLDTVEGLGTFVEIEAIDMDGSLGKDKLYEQCTFYLAQFEIKNEDLLEVSYSDLLLGTATS
jgi:adenylate cyclase class 2